MGLHVLTLITVETHAAGEGLSCRLQVLELLNVLFLDCGFLARVCLTGCLLEIRPVESFIHSCLYYNISDVSRAVSMRVGKDLSPLVTLLTEALLLPLQEVEEEDRRSSRLDSRGAERPWLPRTLPSCETGSARGHWSSRPNVSPALALASLSVPALASIHTFSPGEYELWLYYYL